MAVPVSAVVFSSFRGSPLSNCQSAPTRSWLIATRTPTLSLIGPPTAAEKLWLLSSEAEYDRDTLPLNSSPGVAGM